MDIVYCTDDNYAMPCGVSIISLLENNKDKDFVIHIVGLNLKQESKDQLQLNIERYKNARICFYDISQEIFEKNNLSLYGSKYLSLSAYTRLFLTIILPSTIDKVLYLDCDVIISDSLKELCEVDLNGYSVAGVVDLYLYKEGFERLDYANEHGYINSGVLLINLKYWRENDVIKTFLDYYKNKIDSIKYHDQDIINGVFYKSKLFLPIKFNVNDYYYKVKRAPSIYDDEINVAIRKPSIIHYTLRGKPWLKGCIHPLKDEFEKYKVLSVWAKEPKNWGKTKFKHKIRFYQRAILYSLNLKKKKYLTKKYLIE